MVRAWFCSIAICAIATGGLSAASTFELGFAGEVSKSGSAGAVWSDTYDATLTSTLDAGLNQPGAQGWSVSVSADNASITAVDFESSEAAAQYSGGFKKSELTTKGTGDCAGRNGVVSAIVLSFTEDKRLSAGTVSIAKLSVEGTIPTGAGTATLRYVNGCQGAGQPVTNNVTEEGATATPTLGSLEISLHEVMSCCDSSLNLGFSGDSIDSLSAYDGIVDPEVGDVALCDGLGGTINTALVKGSTGQTDVHANVSSNAAGDGVQGWSLSIGFTIAQGDLSLLSANTEGEPGVDNYYSGGFKKTELIDPTKPENAAFNGGAVSAIVLSFTENKVLPSTSTQSVLRLTVAANSPQGDDNQTGALAFKSGLRGAGQPVQNALTVGGNTASACNQDTARVIVSFGPLLAQTFVRGNANDDLKVNIADAIWMINELFFSGPASPCRDAADANDDGATDSADAAYLIAFQFQVPEGSPPPPAPYPDCGVDPSGDDDGVPCESSGDLCN
jgi:hypothetical protein